MKTYVVSLTVLFLLKFTCPTTAQHELWGMTSEGGGNWGIIYKTDSSGGNFSIEHMITALERHSKSTLMKASNGKYYGMSEGGGLYGKGTIFEYDYATDSVKVLHHFDGTSTGAYPKGDLLQASNGKLYGMTSDGGSSNLGVVFEFDLSGPTYTKIYDFGGYPKGRVPHGSLIQASDGKLYGMAQHGGALGSSGDGTFFEIDLSGPTLTTIHTFAYANSDGLRPTGNLLEVADSLLYGLTYNGGDFNQGIIFKYNINTSSFTKLQSFEDGISGCFPNGSVIQALNGNLLGLYSGGYCCGGVFEYDIDNDTLMQRYDFSSSEGKTPIYTNLVEGQPNIFFGMTNRGGAYDDGAIFKYNLSSDSYTKLYDFSFNDGSNTNAYGSLLESTPGKYLYITRVGGTARVGTISEYDTTAGTSTVRHNFDADSKGVKPKGSLLAASNGRFYGLFSEGGEYNYGTIFEYNPFTGELVKRHDFDGPNGSYPQSSLIEATNGKFYGVTLYGGADGQGVLFEFDPETGVTTKLHDFGESPNPGRPIGSPMQASNGKLYGMSSYGGANWNHGALYEYDISTSSLTTKHNFDNFANDDGRNPEGSLIETSNDTLYGMTTWGGVNDHGTIFEYIISTNTFTKKHDFNDPTGRQPKGSLFQASNGKLYGTTNFGGSNFKGTIFEYVVSTGSFSVIHNFSGTTTGRNPYCTLIESSDGHLYGTTCGDTDPGYEGTLFQLDTATNVVTRLIEFDGSNGSKPLYAQLNKILVHADWTGAVSTDWHDPANWAQNDVPNAFTEVVIPDVSGASGNFPVVSANARARDLTVEPGADINVMNGVVLKVGNED